MFGVVVVCCLVLLFVAVADAVGRCWFSLVLV